MNRTSKNWLITIAVFIGMATLTLLVWRQQVDHQHSLLSQRTEDVCVQAARRLQLFMESHLRVASIFARRWSTHESRDYSQKRFNEFSSIMVQELPGYYAVGLISPDLSKNWVVPSDMVLHDIVLQPDNLQLLQEAKRLNAPVLSKPIEWVQGTATVYAVLPLFRDEEFLGYLVVVFDAQELIDDCFHERIRSKYHFTVRDDDRLVFQSTAGVNENMFTMAAIKSNVSIQVQNRTWRLDMVPKKEKVEAYGWAASLPLPLLGLFMSVGLSLLVFLLLKRMDMFRHASEQQVMLARKVLMAQEDERARISRELHDELGQLLTALRLEMGWMEKSITARQENETSVLGNSVTLVEQATAELRRLCKGLRPPLLDDLGIEPAIKLLVHEFKELSGIEVDLSMNLDQKSGSISKEIALCIYRILQESLTNISRHAGASEVTIKLSAASGQLTLEVEDNGIGFDPAHLGEMQGWGLQGMRERANLVGGLLEIQSSRRQGTRIIFKVSLLNRKNQRGNDDPRTRG